MTKARSNAVANAAKGDLTVGSGTNASGILAVGTNGYSLVADSSASTGIKWGFPNYHGASVYTQAAVSYTANVTYLLPMASETFDSDNYHSTSTNTSRLTIPSGLAGKYLFTFNCRMADPVDYSIIRIYKNGSAVTGNGLESGEIARYSTTAGTTGLSGAVVLDAAVGDYFEFGNQINLTASKSTYACWNMMFLGA